MWRWCCWWRCWPAPSPIGLWPSLFACLVCALAYNFFFLPPLYTFTIAEPENIVTLLVFMLVAVIASNLTARVRTQAIVARERAATTEDLYRFSRKLAGMATLDDLLWATAYQVAHMLELHVVLLLPEGEELEVRAGYPPEDMLDEGDLAAAKWAFEHGQRGGPRRRHLAGRAAAVPAHAHGARRGRRSSDWIREREGPLLTPDQRRLLDSLSDQAALAIERLHLAEEMDRARLAAETEKLRSALLTSISHDLRTPLASILGSASSLQALSRPAGARPTQDELLAHHPGGSRTPQPFHRQSAGHDAAGIRRPGAATGSRWTWPMWRAACCGARRSCWRGHRVALELETACRCCGWIRCCSSRCCSICWTMPPNMRRRAATITLRARARGRHGAHLDVLDEGDGLPEDDRERIFDKFYRVRAGDQQTRRHRAGPGHRPRLSWKRWAAPSPPPTAAIASGAVFTLTLPVPGHDAHDALAHPDRG